MLDNFKPYSVTSGMLTVTFSNYGVSFSRAAVVRLEKPEYATLLINNEEKMIAIQASNENDENASPFYKKRANSVITARWNSKELIKTISSMMNWNLDEESFKVDGDYLPEENAIVFNLKNAEPVTSKHSKEE